MHSAHSPFRRVHIHQFTQANRAVGMKLERLIANHCPDRRNERGGTQRRQKAAGILKIESVYVRAGGKLASASNVVSIIVNGAHCKHQSSDDVLAAGLLDHAGTGEVGIGIVHRVGQREAANSVTHEGSECQGHELGICRLPGDKAEASGKELQRRVWHCLGGQADALPGVFALVANGNGHMSGRGEVNGFETYPIHDWRDA